MNDETKIPLAVIAQRLNGVLNTNVQPPSVSVTGAMGIDGSLSVN